VLNIGYPFWPSMRFKPRPFITPVRFKCLFCLDCCRGRHVYLTVSDIKRLVGSGHDPQKFLTFSIEGGNIRFVLSVREWDLGCIFHDPGTGKCTIHPIRPLICRIYPFMVSKRPLGVEGEEPVQYKGRMLWLYYDESCPGINSQEGEVITPEEIAELGVKFEEELSRTTFEDVIKVL